MAEILLDPKIRLWVFLPIVIITFLVGIVRHYVSIILSSQKKVELIQMQDRYTGTTGKLFLKIKLCFFFYFVDTVSITEFVIFTAYSPWWGCTYNFRLIKTYFTFFLFHIKVCSSNELITSPRPIACEHYLKLSFNSL